MLAAALGSGNKTLYRLPAAAAGGEAAAAAARRAYYVLPFRRHDDARRRLLVVSKLPAPQEVPLPAGWCDAGQARAIGIDAGVAQPGFAPPQARSVTAARLALGGYGLATVLCT